MRWRSIAIAFAFGVLAMHAVGGTFAQSGLHETFSVAFTILMIAAAVSDVRARRIANAIVITILSIGTVFALASMGPKRGLASALEGALVGLALWTPMWALKKLGAGDVKFFAASSVWIGPSLALKASFLAAAFGGVLALVWLLLGARRPRPNALLGRRAQLATVENVDLENVGSREPAEMTMLPYGVAMAAGLTLTAWFPHLLYG
jgi:prepilin peptidase CpaA